MHIWVDDGKLLIGTVCLISPTDWRSLLSSHKLWYQLVIYCYKSWAIPNPTVSWKTLTLTGVFDRILEVGFWIIKYCVSFFFSYLTVLLVSLFFFACFQQTKPGKWTLRIHHRCDFECECPYVSRLHVCAGTVPTWIIFRDTAKIAVIDTGRLSPSWCLLHVTWCTHVYVVNHCPTQVTTCEYPISPLHQL